MTLAGMKIALALSVLAWSAPSAGSQQLHQTEVGIQSPKPTGIDQGLPSGFSLGFRSVGDAALWSIVGGAVGLAVDQAYCERHHGKEPSFPLGPCFLYANEGFGVGWFGGAVLGATLGAVKVAQKRGCPRKAAIIRAALGAALGIAPGVAIAAPRAGKYPPSRA